MFLSLSSNISCLRVSNAEDKSSSISCIGCSLHMYICVSCCNSLHYGCIHAAGILTSSWNTNKPTPKYAIYIFECDNFFYL